MLDTCPIKLRPRRPSRTPLITNQSSAPNGQLRAGISTNQKQRSQAAQVAQNLALTNLAKSYFKKTADVMEKDINKTLEKVDGLRGQIEDLKLPMIKYLADESMLMKPTTSIESILAKNWSFFQPEKSLLTQTRYKPKDFLPPDLRPSRTPSKDVTMSMTRKASMGSLMTNRQTPDRLSTDRTIASSAKKFRLWDIEVPTHLDQKEQMNGCQTERGSGYRRIKMELVDYKGAKVPKGLFSDLVKRKNLLKEIKNGEGNYKKILEGEVEVGRKKR